MARVLFFLQLTVAVAVLPFWPGLGPRYTFLGLVFLALVAAVPAAAVLAVHGPRALGRALADAWSAAPLPPGRQGSQAVWDLAVRTVPAGGLLGGLTSLSWALAALDPGAPLPPQVLTLTFFGFVWGLLGLLVARVLRQVVLELSARDTRPLTVLTVAVGARFGLTPREIQTAQAILDGLTYQGTAEKLNVSPATVKSHILKVYEKTGTGNKIELLRLVEAESDRIHQRVDGHPGASGRD